MVEELVQGREIIWGGDVAVGRQRGGEGIEGWV